MEKLETKRLKKLTRVSMGPLGFQKKKIFRDFSSRKLPSLIKTINA
jgi:hypothetical protein